jgi:uncharacterized membrane protein YcaP (DUF421 family)
MGDKEVKITDLHRILFGEAPAMFLLEVLYRTVIIYIALLVIMRLLGKRMSGELTITELALTIMLGAIIAPPMQMDSRGILVGIFILALVLFYHRTVSFWTTRSKKFEKALTGDISILLKDGVLVSGALKKEQVSRQQIFAQLRQKGYYHSGQLERVYLESSGDFGVFKSQEEQPGLSFLPPEDTDLNDMLERVDNKEICRSCGDDGKENTEGFVCASCGCEISDTPVKIKQAKDEERRD